MDTPRVTRGRQFLAASPARERRARSRSGEEGLRWALEAAGREAGVGLERRRDVGGGERQGLGHDDGSCDGRHAAAGCAHAARGGGRLAGLGLRRCRLCRRPRVGVVRGVRFRHRVPANFGHGGMAMSGVIVIHRCKSRRRKDRLRRMHRAAEQHGLRGIALRRERKDEQPSQNGSKHTTHGRQCSGWSLRAIEARACPSRPRRMPGDAPGALAVHSGCGDALRPHDRTQADYRTRRKDCFRAESLRRRAHLTSGRTQRRCR